MEKAAPSAPPVACPVPPPGQVVAAWPRSAQWTTAFLLGVTITLLAVNGWAHLPWGTRPTELDRAPALSYRVNLNRAGRAELLQLPGVGDSLADRIDAYRRQRGGFRTVDDLVQIHGVGPATVDRLRPWVTVSEGAQEEADSRPTTPGKKGSSQAAKPRAKKASALTAPIDLNRASPEDLQRLPGVGPKISQRIVEARLKEPFRSVDDLRRVSGVGPKTLERLRPYVTVVGEPVRVRRAD